MKKIISLIFLLAALYSCTEKQNSAVINVSFIDSLIDHYNIAPARQINEANIQFWKEKLDKAPVGYVEAQQYASALSSRFTLSGDIKDIRSADSIIHWLNNRYRQQDAGILRTMAAYSITQHRFHDAENYVQQSLNIGSDRYISQLLNFDAAFESGQSALARTTLQEIKSNNEYGYFFRKSKYMHFSGELDSAIASMKQAMALAGNNTYLQQVAASNIADLYMHAADVSNANDMYMQSIRLDASDMHSIAGIGWIALVHDQNDTLAEKIFRFIHSKTKSPDPILKLEQVAEYRNDSSGQKRYALEFVKQVSDTLYGNMYNKYLIDLYTGILNDPAVAVSIASKEIMNRSTPQTYSWLVWSLFKKGEKDKAFALYDKYVSGKPLEGPELFYMGKMMHETGKGYNAQQYFKAAYRNMYDLSPAKQKELEELIIN